LEWKLLFCKESDSKKYTKSSKLLKFFRYSEVSVKFKTPIFTLKWPRFLTLGSESFYRYIISPKNLDLTPSDRIIIWPKAMWAKSPPKGHFTYSFTTKSQVTETTLDIFFEKRFRSYDFSVECFPHMKYQMFPSVTRRCRKNCQNTYEAKISAKLFETRLWGKERRR
jgi:hypothetical protein